MLTGEYTNVALFYSSYILEINFTYPSASAFIDALLRNMCVVSVHVTSIA